MRNTYAENIDEKEDPIYIKNALAIATAMGLNVSWKENSNFLQIVSDEKAKWKQDVAEVKGFIGKNGLIVVDGYYPNSMFLTDEDSKKIGKQIGIKPADFRSRETTFKYPFIQELARQCSDMVSFLDWGNFARIEERVADGHLQLDTEKGVSVNSLKDALKVFPTHFLEEFSASQGKGEKGFYAHKRMERMLLEQKPSTIMMHSTGVALFLNKLNNIALEQFSMDDKINALNDFLPNLETLIFARGNCDRNFFLKCDPSIIQFFLRKGVSITEFYSIKDDVLPASLVVTNIASARSILQRFKNKMLKNRNSKLHEKPMSGIIPNGMAGFNVPEELKNIFIQHESDGNHGKVMEDMDEFRFALRAAYEDRAIIQIFQSKTLQTV